MSSTTTTSDERADLMSVYLRQWKVLRTQLKKRLGSHELAEDALQETWLRLAGMKEASSPIRDRQAFILRVAGNVAIDMARREKRYVGDEDLLKAVADATPSPETFAIDRDQLRFLVLALAKLPAKPRVALLLSRCEGLSHRAIAERLGVSENMITRYLVQAMRHCRDHFFNLA